MADPPPAGREARVLAAAEGATRRRWLHRTRDWLWGYDFFISYHWASGGAYAVNLAQKLRTLGYDVFLDRADYASGDNWKELGRIALGNTQRLVLIATREAVLNSQPVRHEVEIFTSRGRQVIPIVFGDRFEGVDRSLYPTLLRMPEAQLFIDSGADSLKVGPTDETVGELVRTFKVLRRRNIRALLTLIPLLFVTSFAVFATYQWGATVVAKIDAVNAKKDAERSRDDEVRQRKQAERNLAANWYTQSMNESENHHDSFKALLYACEAANAAPEGEQLAVYLDRVLHLAAASPVDVNVLHVGEAVAEASFSPDVRRVALVTQSGAIKVFNLADGKLLRNPPSVERAGDARKTPIQFSEDGNRVMATIRWNVPEPDPDESSTTALLAVWDCRDGTLISPPDSGGGDWQSLPFDYFKKRNSLVFSGNGRVVYFSEDKGAIPFWIDPALLKGDNARKSKWPLDGSGDAAQPVMEPALGIWVGGGSAAGLILRFDPRADKTLTALDVREISSAKSILSTPPVEVPGEICSAAFSGNGKRVVTVSLAGKEYEARCFDFSAGALRAARRPVPISRNSVANGSTAYLRITRVCDDGERVLLSRFNRMGNGGTLDFAGCEFVDFEARTVGDLFYREGNPALLMSRDGRRVVGVRGDDRTDITLCEGSRIVTRTVVPPHLGIGFNRDLTRCLTVGLDGLVLSWPMSPGTVTSSSLATTSPLAAARASRDGSTLVTVDQTRALALWARNTHGNYAVRWSAEVKGGEHVALRYDAAGQRVMAVGTGRKARVHGFSASDGKRCFPPKSFAASEFTYSKLVDAGFVESGDEIVEAELLEEDDGGLSFRRWNYKRRDGTAVNAESWSVRGARAIGLTEDGRYSLTGGYRNDASNIKLTDTKTGKTVAAFQFPAGAAVSGWAAEALLETAAEFLPHGDGRFAVRLRQGAIVDLAYGPDRPAELLLHTDAAPLVSPKSGEFSYATLVALGPNGKYFAAASHDTPILARAKVRVFDARTGQPVTERLWFTRDVLDLSFSPDGVILRVIDVAGELTELTLHRDHPRKPEWLANLGRALTGREVEPNQEVSLMSVEDYGRARQELLDQLNDAAATDPAASLILRWLTADSPR